MELQSTPTASLQKGVVKTPTNECPKNDIKLSDDEAPERLELWGKQSTSLLPLLPGAF